MSSRELAANQLRNKRRDSQSGDWNHERRAARTHICSQIFVSFMRKSLYCGRVYGKSCHKDIFVEGRHASLKVRMRSNSGPHENWTLKSLARHTRSSIDLQEERNSASTSSLSIRYDRYELRTFKRRSENTPGSSMQARRDSNASSFSSKNSFPLGHWRTKQESCKPSKKSH